MKVAVIGLYALLTLNLNAQSMKSPTEVVTGLFIATDQKAWEEVEQAFDSKVLLDYSSMSGSPASELTPEQIITTWKGILPGFEFTHHQLGNVVSTVEENRATVFCYGTASHFLTDDGGNLWIVVGTYDFDLFKGSDGEWKISSMKFNFKYQDGNTTLPEKAINKLK